MYEQLGFEALSARTASVIFGLCIGVLFGVLAQRSRFCLRRAIVASHPTERAQAQAVWLGAAAVAVLGTQFATVLGWLEFSQHRFHTAEISYVAIVIGGLMFGYGMVLTRGCASRLSVLAGSGNLRALLVIVVFTIFAHAALKGALAPLRTALAEITVSVDTNVVSGATALMLSLLLFAAAVYCWLKSGVSRGTIAMSVSIGLLVPAAWLGTGLLLQDDFDPIVFESLSFTSSGTDWLFWTVAGTSVGAGFGVGFFTGVIGGSTISALTRGEFQWQSFESAGQTGRYLCGAGLMGIGGVLAGGCTVGAGLAGVSTLGISAILALSSIITGALISGAILSDRESTSGAVLPV